MIPTRFLILSNDSIMHLSFHPSFFRFSLPSEWSYLPRFPFHFSNHFLPLLIGSSLRDFFPSSFTAFPLYLLYDSTSFSTFPCLFKCVHVRTGTPQDLHLCMVLRLFCLQSLASGGIRASRYDVIRKLITQTYGFRHAFTITNLEKAG